MKEHILEMKMLKGSAFEVEGIMVKPHTLGELVDEVGLEKYYRCISFTSMKKSDLNEVYKLDEQELKKISLYQMLMLHDLTATYIVDFLKFVTRNEEIYYIKEWSVIMVNYENSSVMVDKKNINSVLDPIFKAYCIKPKEEEKEEFNPANEQARKLIEKIKKNRAKAPKAKSDVDLASIISGVAWKSNNANIINVWDLTLFQLYDAFYRLEIIDTYDKTLTGIYHGTIDGKQANLKKQIWFKKYDM